MTHRLVSPVLVARVAELAALQAAVDVCATDDRCVALVAGDAGIGKTRLLRELAARLQADGPRRAAVAWGTCMRPADIDLPFSPIPGLLGGLAAADRSPGPQALVEQARAEMLGTSGHAAVSAAADRGQGRLRTFEAVLGAVRAVMERLDRLVLVVDDAHWADPATLDLVAFLARRLGRSGALVVLAFREETLAPDRGLRSLVLDLERDWVLERVDLRPLSPDQVRAQVQAIGDGHHDQDLIATRSEGNPFVVEELLRLPPGTRAVPDSLRELLRARLVGLAPGPCRLVDVAAVLGRPAPAKLLAAVAGMDDDATRPALEAATRAGILVETGDGIAFRHSLLGEAAVGALAEGTRARLHRVVAATLERSADGVMPPGLLIEIARHWDLGGDVRRTRPALLLAAEAAEKAFAWSSAARAYGRAAELVLRTDGPSAEAARLARRSAEMWLDASEPVLAQARMRDAGRIAGRAGLEGERLRCWAEVAYLYNEVGPIDRGCRLAERILECQDEPLDGEARVRRLLVGGCMRILAGRLAAGLHPTELALEGARDLGLRTEQAEAASLLAHHAASVGDAAAATSRFQVAVEAAPDTLPDAIDTALINRASDGLLLGDWDLVTTTIVAARRVAARFGTDHAPIVLAYLEGIEADLALQTGDLVHALRATEPGNRPARHFHGHHAMLAFEAWAAALAGDPARAMRAIDEGLPLVSRCRWHRAFLGVGEALLRLREGRLEEAGAAATRAEWDIAIDEGLSDPARIRLVALRVAAECAVGARARGDQAAARRAAAGVRPVADWMAGLAAGRAGEGYVVQPVNLARGALGVAEWSRATGVNDAGAWLTAAHLLEDVGLAHDHAYARLRLAEAILSGGGARDEAAAHLAKAERYARAAYAAPLHEETCLLAARARLPIPEDPPFVPQQPRPPAPGGPADPWRLSLREQEVLDLLSQGLTNREIGDRLFITAKTASSHVTHILDKLGVSSRVEAALLAAPGRARTDRGAAAPGSGPARSVSQALPDAPGATPP